MSSRCQALIYLGRVPIGRGSCSEAATASSTAPLPQSSVQLCWVYDSRAHSQYYSSDSIDFYFILFGRLGVHSLGTYLAHYTYYYAYYA